MKNIKGFTLVEILLTVFVVSLFILGFSQVLGVYLNSQRDLDFSGRKQEMIISIVNLINSDVAWQKTIDHAANTTMDCLKDPGKFPAVASAGACTSGDGGKFSLLDESGAVFIDFATATAGFNLNGFCNSFSSSGNDACPLRAELSWRPLCTTCINNQVEVTIELTDAPLNRKTIQAPLTSRKIVRYAQPHDPNLVLFMKLDGSVGSSIPIGTSFTDMSGQKNNGVLTGGAGVPLPSYVAGKIGQGVRFENDKYLAILDSSSLRVAGPITVAAWVNVYAALTTFNGIVSKRNSGTDSSYNLKADATGFSFCVGENGGSRCVTSATPLVTGNWYHVVGTWDMANINLYVNGSLAAGPLAYTGPNYWSAEPVLIGAENRGALFYFPGIIDQVKIWKRSLKATEVMSQFNNF